MLFLEGLVGLHQFSSVAKSYLTLCDLMDYSMPSFPVPHHLLEFAQTHVHWVGDAIQTTHPLLLLPSIFPSIRVFSYESALHIKWTKYWSFSFRNTPSGEKSQLISLKIDWLDLIDVQGTLNHPLQYHNLKAPILQHSAFFIVQLSHDYWKNHSLD